MSEPQAMTLEEALVAIAKVRGTTLAYHTGDGSLDDPSGWVESETGTLLGDYRRWEDAASFALGYPVVERDPAAELAEAATALMTALDRMPVAYTSGHVNAEKFQYETWPKAVRELRAALAAYEASRK